METCKEISYKSHNINIYRDPAPLHPRKDFDNLGTLYTAHRRYQPEKDFDEHFNMHEVCPERLGEFSDTFLQKYIALPIFMYDHSGITIATRPFSCRWDSSFSGIIAVSLEKVRKEYGWSKITEKRRKQIETYLQGEIEALDNYYTGEVYGYTVISEQNDELDSCWGFFGDDGLKQMEDECKSIINNLIAIKRKEKLTRLTEAIRLKGRQLCFPFSAFPEPIIG